MQTEPTAIILEPKYCELCGGLWLRPAGAQAVYCRNCQPAIDALAPVRLRSNQQANVERSAS